MRDKSCFVSSRVISFVLCFLSTEKDAKVKQSDPCSTKFSVEMARSPRIALLGSKIRN